MLVVSVVLVLVVLVVLVDLVGKEKRRIMINRLFFCVSFPFKKKDQAIHWPKEKVRKKEKKKKKKKRKEKKRKEKKGREERNRKKKELEIFKRIVLEIV